MRRWCSAGGKGPKRWVQSKWAGLLTRSCRASGGPGHLSWTPPHALQPRRRPLLVNHQSFTITNQPRSLLLPLPRLHSAIKELLSLDTPHLEAYLIRAGGLLGATPGASVGPLSASQVWVGCTGRCVAAGSVLRTPAARGDAPCGSRAVRCRGAMRVAQPAVCWQPARCPPASLKPTLHPPCPAPCPPATLKTYRASSALHPPCPA